MNDPIDISTRKPIVREERLPQPVFRSHFNVFVGTLQDAWDLWVEDTNLFEQIYGWGFADPRASAS